MVSTQAQLVPRQSLNLRLNRLGDEGGKMLLDGMLENYTDDCVFEFPYSDPERPVRLEGRETVRSYLTSAFETFRFGLEITEVHPTSDPDKIVLEYVSDGSVVPTAKPYGNRYIGIFWFRDGRISHVREFYNPAVAARALRPD